VADGAFGVHARIVRNNRSTQHWTVQLVQHREVVATGTAVFARRRQTWSAPEAVPPAGVPRPEQLPRAPLEGRPAWFHHYDMRFVGSALTGFDGRERPDSLSHLWIRDDPPRPLDFASLAAICDGFIPRIFLRRGLPTAVGTVSMTTFFHADEALLGEQADRHALGVARALAFRNGFFDQSAELWSHTGHLLASTHQIVYFRE
jgi:acyl-CoA thioesterase